MAITKKGMSPDVASLKAIQALIRSDHFNVEQMAAMLDMSGRTFRRKLDKASFDRLEAERLDRISELVRLGEDTFGSTEKFMMWLRSTPETFGGAKPLDLLTFQKGIDWITETLIAIQHGLPE